MRPFNRSTKLGKLMWEEGWSVQDLERVTGVSYRVTSDYLAGRIRIPARHLTKFCEALGVEAEEIVEDEVEEADGE